MRVESREDLFGGKERANPHSAVLQMNAWALFSAADAVLHFQSLVGSGDVEKVRSAVDAIGAQTWQSMFGAFGKSPVLDACEAGHSAVIRSVYKRING